MPDLHESVIVGLGEVLWDCFGDIRKPGGATANVGFHASELGHVSVVCSRVGRDALGAELVDYLADHHLDTRYIQQDPAHPTGTVTVDVSRPDRPTYVIHQDVAWDFIEFTDDLAALMRRAAAVCFGSLGQRSPRSRQTIQQCLDAAAGALRVMDINLRQSWYDREGIDLSLRKSHIAKLNIDEAAVLAPLLDLPPDPIAFAQRMRSRYDLQLVCITRAEHGCLLISSDEVVDASGVPVQVVDAVGSGDAFSAAMISARLRGLPLQRTAAFANAVGALVASRPGGMPDLRQPYADLVARFRD
jgi:fructokinase